MGMRNPVEDIRRSLGALPGLLSQLMYLASLRDRAGQYQHWGLTREYGEGRIAAAFRHCHRNTYDGLLQSDLSELLATLGRQCEENGQDPKGIITELLHEAGARPEGTQEHAVKHFNYVLASLLALSQPRY
jgi:hypothetical protein